MVGELTLNLLPFYAILPIVQAVWTDSECEKFLSPNYCSVAVG